jgi:hypothetical protein
MGSVRLADFVMGQIIASVAPYVPMGRHMEQTFLWQLPSKPHR